MNRFICRPLLIAAIMLPFTAIQAQKAAFKDNMDTFSYAVGMNVAQSMKNQGIDHINGALLVSAMEDVFNGKQTKLTEEMANNNLQSTIQAYMKKKADAARDKEQSFFTENKKKPGVTALPNGLQYEIIKSGSGGAKPKPVDTVVVNYKGTLTDGSEFDNSFKRGEPATFPLNAVIRGWTEILQLMSIGDSWKVYIPSELGYGERGAGGAIPGHATLIFEIELLDIKPASK